MDYSSRPNNTKALPLSMCLLLNLPEGGVECSSEFPKTCIYCSVRSAFMSGEGITEISGAGHVTCLILAILVALVGSCGAILSCLIIIIVQKREKGCTFDKLLVALACFDLACSVVSVVDSLITTTIYHNWSKGLVTMYAQLIATLLTFFTVLITIERFFIVCYPIRSRIWFTTSKTKWLIFGVSILALVLSIPRFSSAYIGVNKIGKDIESIKDYEHIILSTSLEKFWYRDLKGFLDMIDFWGTFPILLLFNGLVYYQIWKMSSCRHKVLNRKQRKDIQAGKMFIPVVIVLILCNIEPTISFYVYTRHDTFYKELGMGFLLSMALTSAANFPIYYFRSAAFRNDANSVLSQLFPCWFKNIGDDSGSNNDSQLTQNKLSR